MKNTTTTLVNTQASVAVARHRAIYAWCTGGSVGFASFMPNTKRQRLRTPSTE